MGLGLCDRTLRRALPERQLRQWLGWTARKGRVLQLTHRRRDVAQRRLGCGCGGLRLRQAGARSGGLALAHLSAAAQRERALLLRGRDRGAQQAERLRRARK